MIDMNKWDGPFDLANALTEQQGHPMTDRAREVMRYDHYHDQFGDCFCGLELSPLGSYVEYTHYARLLAENAALVKRADAAEKDAGRWRYVRAAANGAEDTVPDDDGGIDGVFIDLTVWSHGAVTEWEAGFGESELDAAIDAAREQEGKT